eukprot:330378-Rhodomonas_salina.2
MQRRACSSSASATSLRSASSSRSSVGSADTTALDLTSASALGSSLHLQAAQTAQAATTVSETRPRSLGPRRSIELVFETALDPAGRAGLSPSKRVAVAEAGCVRRVGKQIGIRGGAEGGAAPRSKRKGPLELLDPIAPAP